jgi:uncharacterized membrane protein YfcA
MLAWSRCRFKWRPILAAVDASVMPQWCFKLPAVEIEALSAGLFVWLACVMLISGTVQGMLGFGFPFIATPLVAMVSDMRTAIIAVLLPTLATILVALFTSGPLHATLARFWMMPLYMIAGASAGTLLFVYAPGFPYSLLLALLTLVYLNLDRMGLSESPFVGRHEHRFGVLSGLTAGVFEGTANVAGPALIIFYLALGLTPVMFVQALNICFLIGKSTQLAVMTAYGAVTAAQWLATVPLAAADVAGSYAGVRLRDRVDAETYRIWVKRALLVIALVLVGQYAWSLIA